MSSGLKLPSQWSHQVIMTIEATTVTSSLVSSVPGPCSTGQRWWMVEKYESTHADSHSLGTGDGGGGAPCGPQSASAATARRMDCKAAHAVELFCCPAADDAVEAAGDTHDGMPAKMPMAARLGVVPELSVNGGDTGAEPGSGTGRGMDTPLAPGGDVRARFFGGDSPLTPAAATAASRRPYVQATPRFAHSEHCGPPSHFVLFA